MKNTASVEEIVVVFREWVANDWYDFDDSPKDDDRARPHSIRELIESLSFGASTLNSRGKITYTNFSDINDLNTTFEHYVNQNFRKASGDFLSIRTLIIRDFCRLNLPKLVELVQRDDIAESRKSAMFAEFSVNNWQDWARAVLNESTADLFALHLFDTLFALLKENTLFSFFIQEQPSNGFLTWSDYATTDIGHKLASHDIAVGRDTVTISVNRYDENEGPVTAYEWSAKLTGADQALNAIACGMVYIFEREDGVAIGNRSDLLCAADSVADTDVLQVNAFLTQHSDADAVINDGDLCFVWLWERRNGTTPGIGASCLKAAIEDLTTRFKRLSTVVFDARPSQFISWDRPYDPPMITVAKQTAIESLVAHISALNLTNVQVRHIFNHDEGNQAAALIALGSDALNAMDSDELPHDEDDSVSFDWEMYALELIQLFQRAGLDDLCQRIEKGDIECIEIVQVLKHVLLHRRIPYLPYSVTSSTKMHLLYGEGLDLDDEDIASAIDEFEDALPIDVALIRVVACADTGNPCADLVAVVEVDTKLCAIQEFFTLMPVPRPVDGSFFLL
jgi:hypothetical protein